MGISDRAVPWRRTDGLSVVEPLLAQAAGIRLGVDLVREEAEPALREFVEATLPEPVRHATHVRMEVTVGNPSEAILQTGRRLKAGLIVMGTLVVVPALAADAGANRSV